MTLIRFVFPGIPIGIPAITTTRSFFLAIPVSKLTFDPNLNISWTFLNFEACIGITPHLKSKVSIFSPWIKPMINALGLKEETLPAVLPDSVKAQIVFAFTRFEVLQAL